MFEPQIRRLKSVTVSAWTCDSLSWFHSTIVFTKNVFLNCSVSAVGTKKHLVLQEKILLDPMFEVPGSDIVEVIISEGVVKDQEPAKYIRRPTESTPEVAHDDDSGFENEEISARNP